MRRKIIKIEDIEVRVDRRKNYKNLNLKIIPPLGEVRLSGPNFITDKQIKEFIGLNIDDIRLAIERYRKKYNIDKNIISIWSKEYKLITRESTKNRVYIENEKIYLGVKDFSQKDKVLDSFLRKELENKVEILIKKYSKLMEVDVSEFRIRKMKSRWGTCNIRDKRIWINFELVKYPEFCLEYVIIHELAHLFERGHNKRFYSIVEKYLPDWQKANNYLKKHIIFR